MLKIDIDTVHRRSRFEMQRIMYSLPRPFFVRISSSGEGLHLVVPALDEWDWQRYAYDDPMRIDLDTQREHHRLPVRNLLWDVKNGKPAGQWRIIRTERDIENYIDANKQQSIYVNNTHTNTAQNGQETKNRDRWNKCIYAEAPERGLHATRSRQDVRSGYRRDRRTGVEHPGQPGVPQVEDLK